jgi:hypothetical protein
MRGARTYRRSRSTMRDSTPGFPTPDTLGCLQFENAAYGKYQFVNRCGWCIGPERAGLRRRGYPIKLKPEKGSKQRAAACSRVRTKTDFHSVFFEALSASCQRRFTAATIGPPASPPAYFTGDAARFRHIVSCLRIALFKLAGYGVLAIPLTRTTRWHNLPPSVESGHAPFANRQFLRSTASASSTSK